MYRSLLFTQHADINSFTLQLTIFPDTLLIFIKGW